MTRDADIPDALRDALADRYRLERKLGEGGMATVYLARDLRHDRDVAVKVLKPDLAHVLGGDRFLREVRIAAKLSHPHILPLHDSGEANGFLYYVMPFVKGQSLRERLSREGELPVSDAIRMLKEIADALAHAHDEGIVHRDIKPDNVMVSGRHVLVSDFGVAKAVSEATGRNALTTAGVALGTPSYMAPEQAAGDPNVDQRADIYALGALAYELLTGHPPFLGRTPQMVLAAHVTEVPEPVRKTRPAVPVALADAVGRCLEKKPADRFQSAADLVAMLESLETPSGGHPPAEVPRRSAASSRRRIAVAGAAGVVLLLAGGIGVALLMRGGTVAGAAERRSLAILPFSNTSGDPANDAFTNGLHDDLLTQVSKIAALRVTSRTSVMEYRGTTKNIRDIGAELGVATILEGGVQRAGNRVRVNAQLIDATTDRHLWAENYNRELTAANVFAIQGEIAQSIARALEARLSPAEHAAIARRPTENIQAYEHYLRGLAAGYWDNDTVAVTEFERATELDPGYAAAWAAESRAYAWQHRLMGQHFRDGSHSAVESARRSREALRHAIALDSSALETRLAQAYAEYYLNWDFEAALRHLEPLSVQYPNNAELHNAIALQYRRLGRWDESLARMQRALELDSRNPDIWPELGWTLFRMGRHRQALETYETARQLGLETPKGTGWRLYLRLVARADTAAVRSALASLPAGDLATELEIVALWYLRATGDTATLRRFTIGPRAQLLSFSFPAGLRAARVMADSVRRALAPSVSEPHNRGERYRVGWTHLMLATAGAVRGTRAEALQSLRQAASLLSESFDAVEFYSVVVTQVDVYLAFGMYADAMAVLEGHSAIFPAAWLRMDRLLAPVRGDPRFATLVERAAAAER